MTCANFGGDAMKKIFRLMILITVFFNCGVLFAATNTNDPAYDQARQDYRAYLEKLKELSQQYNQVTSQIKQVIKEEGIPTVDENTGQIKITHDLNFSNSGPIRETEKEIKLVMEKPGLKKDSIRINIEDNRILHVQAVKKAIEAGQQEAPFDETYNLPVPVQDSNTHAKYEDGILTVTLQKIQTSKKTVPVPVQ